VLAEQYLSTQVRSVSVFVRAAKVDCSASHHRLGSLAHHHAVTKRIQVMGQDMHCHSTNIAGAQQDRDGVASDVCRTPSSAST
jgi:hypothetical protein